jgi:hypothetical protein
LFQLIPQLLLVPQKKGRGEALKIMPMNRPIEILAVQEIVKLLRA